MIEVAGTDFQTLQLFSQQNNEHARIDTGSLGQ
jgi:hypothetical protein